MTKSKRTKGSASDQKVGHQDRRDFTAPERLAEVARRALIEGENYASLAESYGCSKAQIGRLIEKARQESIVEIYIYGSNRSSLEGEIRKYHRGLERVRVVPTPVPVQNSADARKLANQEQLKLLGRHAAELFDEIVCPGDHVLLTGGLTVFQMVSRIEERDRDIQFWPTALIGRGGSRTHLDSFINMSVAWARSGAVSSRFPHVITVYPYLEQVKNEIAKKKLSSDNVEARLEILRNVVENIESGYVEQIESDYTKQFLIDQDRHLPNVAFLSTGVISLEEEATKDPEWRGVCQLLAGIVEPSDLLKEHAAAELAYCFVNDYGQPIEKLKCFCGANFQRLESMRAQTPKRPVVLIAGSSFKERAIRAVLRTGLISHLVIDHDTGKNIVA